jgi:hypothetical protein
MSDLAHACLSCRTITIFTSDAPFPRVCSACDAILRATPVPCPEDDDEFVLELGPELVPCAPF